jgi:hypothetical protein
MPFGGVATLNANGGFRLPRPPAEMMQMFKVVFVGADLPFNKVRSALLAGLKHGLVRRNIIYNYLYLMANCNPIIAPFIDLPQRVDDVPDYSELSALPDIFRETANASPAAAAAAGEGGEEGGAAAAAQPPPAAAPAAPPPPPPPVQQQPTAGSIVPVAVTPAAGGATIPIIPRNLHQYAVMIVNDPVIVAAHRQAADITGRDPAGVRTLEEEEAGEEVVDHYRSYPPSIVDIQQAPLVGEGVRGGRAPVLLEANEEEENVLNVPPPMHEENGPNFGENIIHANLFALPQREDAADAADEEEVLEEEDIRLPPVVGAAPHAHIRLAQSKRQSLLRY